MKATVLIGILFIHSLMGILAANAVAEPPKVFSTNPPNGAIGVRPDFRSVYIIFDKPMVWPILIPDNKCISFSKNVGDGAVVQWGENIFHLERSSRADLPFGTVIRLTLNPPGAASDCFRDTEGNRLPTYSLTFTIRQNPDDPPIEPQVVATNPPDGATGVNPNISSISITFDKPMADTSPLLGPLIYSYGWGPSSWSWSADQRTFTFTRENAGDPLPSGRTNVFVLNPLLYSRFQDTQGNVLNEFSYSFTIEGDLETLYESMYDVQIIKVPADPGKGFHWPYYLSVPNTPLDPSLLFVAPNNTGMDAYDPVLHDVTAKEILYWQTATVNDWNLKVPVLVPTFPRYPGQYFQSLGPVAFQKNLEEEVQRIDLQLIGMIEDAKERLRSMEAPVYKKVFMMGFSASGTFTNMFSIMHPEIVQACSIGGGPPTILYREGTAWKFKAADRIWDLQKLAGTPFNLRAYQKVPQYIFVGDQDGNYETEGWEYAKAKYAAMEANAQFIVYSGVGHWYSPEMLADLKGFFDQNKTPTDVYLMAPNGGEILQTGISKRVLWTAPTDATKFKLFYSVDNGITWKPITDDFLNASFYDWQIPPDNKNRKACLVKVMAYNQNGVKVGMDKSDKPFSIEVVKLTSPNGGEVLQPGPFDIAWEIYETIRDVTKVQLSYTTNGGITWIPIPIGVPPQNYGPGSYSESWTVPSVDKNRCTVKVVLKDAQGATIGSDKSDSLFKIQP